jgi:hypothetical protein
VSDLERPDQSGSEIEAPASDSACDDEADKMGSKSSEILLSGQASTRNGSNVEERTIPATPLAPARLNSPSPASVPVPPLDASSSNPYTVYAPETRTGRKRKARDLHAMLAVCTCGEAVTEFEITRDENVIECRRAGCETIWVSEIVN